MTNQERNVGSSDFIAINEQFKIGTLILTYTCPLACKMCFFESNPNRRERLDNGIARQFVADLARNGIKWVGFAGGEPVLRMDLLCELIGTARRLGMTPIVITSGYWGKTRKQADSVVSKLRQAGLDWIQLSLDEDHLEFVKLEEFATALAASKAAGFENIKVIGTSRGNKGNLADLVFYLERVLEISTEGMDLIDRYRVSHGNFESEQATHSLDELEAEVLKPACLTEIMLDVNGDVYPCCQNFIGRIGNLRDTTLDQVWAQACARPEFREFKNCGPLEYARRLDRRCGTAFQKEKYGSWCEVCSKIFGQSQFEDLFLHGLSKRTVLARAV
jgi:MoaA/NifB/PqqE/SkfB family radical SAM enzyme